MRFRLNLTTLPDFRAKLKALHDHAASELHQARRTANGGQDIRALHRARRQRLIGKLEDVLQFLRCKDTFCPQRSAQDAHECRYRQGLSDERIETLFLHVFLTGCVLGAISALGATLVKER